METTTEYTVYQPPRLIEQVPSELTAPFLIIVGIIIYWTWMFTKDIFRN